MQSSPNDTSDNSADLPSSYPGERLGLPENGQRSIARLPRRIGALVIDYGIAIIVSLAFFDYDTLALSIVFAVVNILFIPTIGGSIGHRIFGLAVVPTGGGYVGFLRPIGRTLLLCLVIPAVMWDSDQRGFHDKLAGTMLVLR